jgi:hypothetical protein
MGDLNCPTQANTGLEWATWLDLNFGLVRFCEIESL